MSKHAGFIPTPMNIHASCDATVLKHLSLAPEDDAPRPMKTLREAIFLDVLKSRRNDQSRDARKAVAIYNATGTWTR